MTSLHFVAGDDDGGAHVQITMSDLDCEPDEITDEQVAKGNEAVREQFLKAFGEHPQSVIVWVT